MRAVGSKVTQVALGEAVSLKGQMMRILESEPEGTERAPLTVLMAGPGGLRDTFGSLGASRRGREQPMAGLPGQPVESARRT